MMMRKRIFTVEAFRFTSREDAHEQMQRVFRRHGYYGGNLDALHDVLTSFRRDATVRVVGLETAEAHLGEYAGMMRQVFLDSAEENPHLTLEFSEPVGETAK